MFLDETFRVKVGLAEMLKGGVIMDVTNADQALIAEKARRYPPRRRRRAHGAHQ
jgi:pyridoxal biosynthesis lyase PdxS